jgi:predicted nucleic acid-binding protein
VLCWLVPEPLTPHALLLRQQWRDSNETLIAPDFMRLEVASVLRNSVYRGGIGETRGEAAFEEFRNLAILYFRTDSYIEAAWAASKRTNAPRCYDMTYFALAESQRCELWTADLRLVNLVSAQHSWVKWTGSVTL